MTNIVGDPGLDDFSGRIGRAFLIEVSGYRVELSLDVAEEVPGSPRGRGGFRLEFLGPLDPMLAQGIVPLAIDDDFFEVFLVAIAQEGTALRYEAVFF
ncbi:MAG: hypothetical protein QOH47_3476 [Sphingomonadales bacterium]|jgi:hypothetical protein|nr:hypothetical protein [Sphingomonadales bacterium]